MAVLNVTSEDSLGHILVLNGSGNASVSNTEASSSQLNIRLFRTLKLVLYTAIFLISATGNTMVCAVILRRKKMKTVTNYFILNLAVADLALTCICIPFDIPVQEMSYLWPYGAAMCKILYPLQTMTLFASVYTLTAVSLTRYWAIVKPMRRQLSVSRAKVVIVSIWLASVIPVSPYAQSLRLIPETRTCEEYWNSKKVRKVYTVVLFVFQYILPLTVIGTAYAAIARELRCRKRARSGNNTLRHLQAQEARKVVNMLSVVTVVFAFCMLPNNIMWLWLDFGNADLKYEYFWELVAMCNIVTFANSAANPICYTALNETYRRELRRFVVSLCRQDHVHGVFRRLSSRTTSLFTSSTKSTKSIASYLKEENPTRHCIKSICGYRPTELWEKSEPIAV